MMSSPGVTVLMAVYNGERFLRPAVDSVLRQTFPDLELLVVDDASTDATPAILGSYADPRIRVIRSQRNGGAGRARNAGIEAARGEFVAVLDADDIAYPDRLRTQVAFLDANPQVALVGAAYDVIDEDGRPVATVCHRATPMLLRWELLFRNVIGTLTTVYRRDAALRVGGYDQQLPPAEDYALLGRLAAEYSLHQLGEVVGAYRIRPGGLTHTKRDELLRGTLEVSRRNVAALLGREVDSSEVRCLTPVVDVESISPGEALAAYRLIDECLSALFRHLGGNRAEKSGVLIAALSSLLRLARLCPEARRRALLLGLKVSLREDPRTLLSPRFAVFAARVLTPPRSRWRPPRRNGSSVRASGSNGSAGGVAT